MHPSRSLLVAIGLACGLAHQVPSFAQGAFAFSPDPSAEANIDYIMSAPRLPYPTDECPPCLSGPKLPFGRLNGKLTLSDDQAKKIYDLQRKYSDQIADKVQDYNTMVRDLQDLLTSASTDVAKIKTQEKAINDQRAAIADLSLQEELDSLALLNNDQRDGLKTIMIRDKQRKHHFW